MDKPIRSFKHSGDLGDIIFALPCLKQYGNSRLLLDTTGGESDPYVSWKNHTHTKFNRKGFHFLRPLLEAQDYIDSVAYWDPNLEKEDVNLNKFRRHIKYNNLTDSHFVAIGQAHHAPRWHREKWLEVEPKPLPDGKDIVMARSCRYHSHFSYWEQIDDEIIDRSVFIALPEEFEYFLYTFPRYRGRIELINTESVMDLAGYIQSCSLFIGNQGFPHAIAEAMKKDMINEVYRVYPSCINKRANVEYV